jgi:hypothetical protein
MLAMKTMTNMSANAQSAPDSSTELADDFAQDRRKRTIPVATDRRRANNAAEKRRTSERRRLIDPTTCERDYNDEENIFMRAMDRYKRENRRPFPTWSEVLEVLRSLGYRQVEPATELPGNGPKKELAAAAAAVAAAAILADEDDE